MNEKLLLVDDEEGIRKVLGISLADMGYSLLTAENGEEALRIFAAERPAIVVTDIKMPGMDGIDLLQKLKYENPDAEVIIITGHGDMDLAIRSLKYDATDFITKPIDDRALGNALQKARERIKLREQLRNYTHGLEGLIREKSERLARVSPSGWPSGWTDAQYHHLFEELPGYVTVIDTDFALTAANRSFKEDFRFDPVAGAKCHAVIRNSDEPCLNCPVEKTFYDGKSHQRDMKLKTPDGETRNLFAWTTPLQDADGAVQRVMMMSTDISQVVDLQDHLASLGLMVGSVSHGIKGLLTGLDGGLYMLDAGVSKDDPDKMKDGLQTVKTMAGRIRNMVLDILYYAKERTLNKAEVNVLDFAESVARVVDPKARESGVRLERKFDERLTDRTATVDEDQLRAALVNILENAVDACKADAANEDRFTAFRVINELDDLIFEIEDNGIGMDKETRERIFTLFFSSKSTGGTGIGLFVARKIVTQHGGDVTVSSKPGEGSRFWVRIPMG